MRFIPVFDTIKWDLFLLLVHYHEIYSCFWYNSVRLIPVLDTIRWDLFLLLVLQRETYSHYCYDTSKSFLAIWWLAFQYQLFAAGAPLICTGQIFFLKLLKLIFCFKEWVSLKKFKYSMLNEHYQLITRFNPVNTCWIIPLKKNLYSLSRFTGMPNFPSRISCKF